MSERPQRPRQHELEDESRRAFEAALPTGWVYRTVDRDYGIDGEVEIFHEGQATGLLFKVQLRATGDASLSTVRLRRAQANYFGSLITPVLVVLFREPDSALFVRWFQSFDPKFDRETERAVTFNFNDSHLWTAETASRLQQDMEVIRALKDGRNVFPIPLLLEAFGDDPICGVDITQVRVSLRAAATEYSDLLRLVDEPASAMGLLRVHPDAIAVDFRTLASSTFHYPAEWSGDPDVDRVVADAMSALGVVLRRFGFDEPAARLFERFALTSSAPQSKDIVGLMVSTLMATRRHIPALRLLERAQEVAVDDGEYIRLISSVEFSHARSRLSDEEAEEVADHLRRRFESSPDERTSAEASYNIANWLQAVGRRTEAIEWYERAAQLNDEYLQRDYYHGELGSSQFESGRYAEAVDSYQRAVAIRGDDPHLRVLLADALLMAGRFEESEATFREALNSPDITHPEWPLKLHALDAIRRVGGDIQSRDEDAAHRLLDTLEADLEYDAARGILEAALERDALCADAWARLGFLDMERGSENAFVPIVVGAVIARHSVELWTTSTLLAVTLDEDELVNQLIRCAYFFRGDDFARALMATVRALSDERKARALSILESVMQESKGGSSLTIRQFREDGTVDPIIIEFSE